MLVSDISNLIQWNVYIKLCYKKLSVNLHDNLTYYRDD